MTYLGERLAGSVITFQLTTTVNGIPTTMAGSPTVSVYKTNNTTQSTAGVTLTYSGGYDGVTGLVNISIDTSADGSFYSGGSDFDVVLLGTPTLGGVSIIGMVLGHFSIGLGATRIRKNTALAGFMFVMTDSTTHQPATGLTVTGTVSKDAAAFGALTNAVSEVSNGWYKVDLAAADTNGDIIALKFTAASADQLDITIVTQVG